MSKWSGERLGSWVSLCLLGIACFSVLSGCAPKEMRPPIIIAADERPEQRLFAELTAQFLENRGYDVKIEHGLPAEWMTRKALEAGSVGLVWQETRHVWHTYLHHDQPIPNEGELYQRVKQEDFANGILWLAPCPWSARMGLIVARDKAAAHGLVTIDDLAGYISKVNPDLVLCTPQDLYGSLWEIRGLERAYRFTFKAALVRFMTHEEAYQGLLEGSCDVALGYPKDVAAFDGALVALRDSRAFFSASNWAPTIHASVGREYPELERVLAELVNALDAKSLATMKQRLEAEKARPDRLAAQFLRSAGLLR